MSSDEEILGGGPPPMNEESEEPESSSGYLSSSGGGGGGGVGGLGDSVGRSDTLDDIQKTTEISLDDDDDDDLFKSARIEPEPEKNRHIMENSPPSMEPVQEPEEDEENPFQVTQFFSIIIN